MQLKQYQQQTLKDLEEYIQILNGSDKLSEAYRKFWEDCRGLSLSLTDSTYIHPYINTVNGVARVTLKVPTAGGKTFIACNAIRRIFDTLRTCTGPKVVAWFVPSDTILKQTLEKLQDPRHPYRQTIDALFNHQVIVVDKDAAMHGQGFNPEQLKSQLVILVLSAQSFIANIRAKNSDIEQNKPKALRENGNFLELSKHYTQPEKLIEGIDITALIQAIAQQSPLVIVDESHNFRTELRNDLLSKINPRFILELTATPRDTSNIVSFVDAMQLKKENMVKLPVMVENRNKPKDVLSASIRMRDSLEKLAIEMEQRGGRYIRPIVLFQAQPRTDDDNVNFDKIKQLLLNLGIPEAQIKIKTANKDELEGLDLMSRDCEVRYIITVNALKEGWDCPFAYILATLANKTSRVDVEQILGRILRQPYTVRHDNDLLNLSYVFTSSNDFRETVEDIVRSLQKAGFSRKDFREITPVQSVESKSMPAQQTLSMFKESKENGQDEEHREVNDNEIEELDLGNVEELKAELSSDNAVDEIANLQTQAQQLSDEYNQIIEEQEQAGDIDPLAPIIPREKMYSINEQYKDVAANMNIPTFHIQTNQSQIFTDNWIELDKSMLSQGFDLSKEDANIEFKTFRPDAVTIDVASSGDAVRRANRALTEEVRKYFLENPATSKKRLCGQIAGMIKLDDVGEFAIQDFVSRAISGRDADEIRNLITNMSDTCEAIKKKIEELLDVYREKIFTRLVAIKKIKLKGHYTFIDKISMKDELVGIDKGLYAAEERVNGFECDVVSAIADHPNVLFWHRNRKNKEFCINGFINHYPDFIVKMKSGATIIVETKGDHLDNSDTAKRISLGNKWASLAGDGFHYFMVFETKKIKGAITVKEFLHYLDEL